MLYYNSRFNRPVAEKAAEFQTSEGGLKHVIFSRQYTTKLLDEICNTAEKIRTLSKNRTGQDFLINLLPHKRAMLYFTQPSTRTFLSFMAACQILGITCNEVRNPSVSSETKGETRFDSIRMFSSYFDVIIMRSKLARLAESCAYLMDDLNQTGNRSVPIVNAGSGADEHPTQALLDIYTLKRTFQFKHPEDSDSSNWLNHLQTKSGYTSLTTGLDNKTYAFCGDIGRGRTVRSLSMLLTQYKNVRLVFVAPDHPNLRMGNDLRARLIKQNVEIYEVDSLEAKINGTPVIEMVDALYMTRIQKEHDSPADQASYEQIDFSNFCLSTALVSRMKEYAPILHPFPRDQHFGEIPPEIDNDTRVMYFRQARNGMWARAALLAHLFDVDYKISSYFANRE